MFEGRLQRGGCVWRVCVEGVCGGCVEGVCGGCVEGVCGGCVEG